MAEHKLYVYKGYDIYLNEMIYNKKEIKVEFLAKSDIGEVGPKESILLLRDAIDRLTHKKFDRICIIKEARYNDSYEKAEVTSYNPENGEYWIITQKNQKEKERVQDDDKPINDTPENWKIIDEIKNKKKAIEKIEEEIEQLQETFEKIDLA